MSALTVPGSFTITRGEELVRSWQPADGWGKSFCGECGSHLFSTGLENPELVAVRMGVLDEDPGTRPSFHQFVDYAAAWDVLPDDGLPRYGERVRRRGRGSRRAPQRGASAARMDRRATANTSGSRESWKP